MPVYDVMIRQGNRINKVPIVARSDVDARSIAARQGVMQGVPKVRRESRLGGMSATDRYVFLHQLATMCIARVKLSDGLRVLRESHGGRIAKCAAGLEAGVVTGRDLPELIYEDKVNFPGAVGLLVKAGAKGAAGTADSLKKAAEFEREILSASTKGAKGLYSAAFWVVVATLSLLACPLWLTPYLKESQLFQMSDKPMDWAWLDGLSFTFGGITMLLLLFGLFIFLVIGVGQRLAPVQSDAIVMRIPYLKDIVFSRDNFVSLYRFSLMVKAGVTMEEALDVTWADTREGTLKEDLARARRNVKAGRPWAEGFRTVHATDRVALAMATDKSRLAVILEQVADQNRAIYIRRLEVIQPIMTMISGVSMLLVYGITGLYSIVPFSELFGRLLSDASTF